MHTLFMTATQIAALAAAITSTAPAFLAKKYDITAGQVMAAVMADVPGARARLAELVAAALESCPTDLAAHIAST